jgi:nitrate reductase beta subunit
MNPDGSWAEDRSNPIYYLVKVAKVALPLYPQLGTAPNGFYMPPRWVPRGYLKQMFGPGVDEAIAKYLVPDRELVAVLQLFRKTNRIIFRYEIQEGPKVYEAERHGKPFALYNDTIIGYGEDGQELVRTQVEEPVHVRPAKHLNSI